MNILIIGQTGQLASELSACVPAWAKATFVGRPECDLTNTASLHATFTAVKPSVVINASAYTAVDKAESEPEAAYAVNSDGVKNIAQACKHVGARLLHVSTDFVFGNSSALTADGIAPLLPNSPFEPISVYGASKLAGEQHIQALLPETSVIVRTAWGYSVFGNNFVKTMLRLMAEKPELGIIADQIGTPTWAKGLAQWLWLVAANTDVKGTFHWTDAGAASWYDFAVAIQELALEKGLLSKEIPIKAISTASYPTPAKRPGYSVLDKTTAENAVGMATLHWRKQLCNMLDDLKAVS